MKTIQTHWGDFEKIEVPELFFDIEYNFSEQGRGTKTAIFYNKDDNLCARLTTNAWDDSLIQIFCAALGAVNIHHKDSEKD